MVDVATRKRTRSGFALARHRPNQRGIGLPTATLHPGHPSWILAYTLPSHHSDLPRISLRRFGSQGPLVTLCPVPQLLGKGSFGSVYCVRRTQDRSLHVMKKISVHNMPAKVPPTRSSTRPLLRPHFSPPRHARDAPLPEKRRPEHRALNPEHLTPRVQGAGLWGPEI